MIDLGVPIWLPPKPAIIRPAEKRLIDPAVEVRKGLVFPGMMHIGNRFDFLGTFGNDNTAAITPVGANHQGQAGDLMVAIAMRGGWVQGNFSPPSNFPPFLSTPLGWNLAHFGRRRDADTSVVEDGDYVRGMSIAIHYRRLDGTETSSVSFLSGLSSPGCSFSRSLRFSGGGDTITVHGQNDQGTSGNPAAQNLLASALEPPVIILAVASGLGGGAQNTAFSQFSPAADAQYHHQEIDFDGGAISTNIGFQIGRKIYNSNPQDTVVDMADVGPAENLLVSCMLKG